MQLAYHTVLSFPPQTKNLNLILQIQSQMSLYLYLYFVGNGCGHTLLGAESGTLASQNYPGTYPSNIFCKWRLRVPEGRTLRLLFGDFDIENSPGCSNGSLVITDKIGYPSLGPVCGKLDSSQRNVTLSSNEVVITFMSGTHRSGRGFLLSYATDLHPELISCLQRGSHFSSLGSLYCPAGCKNVTGDVWGSSEQGYRDTSVLCKGAVHAGVISDSVGGRVTVTRERSLTLYESTFANGVLSKIILFSKDKKIWKLYKDPLTKEKKVFQAYTDGHLRVLNSLAPSVVARFVRILPTSWKGQATLQVQVMGCPVSKVTPKTRSNAGKCAWLVHLWVNYILFPHLYKYLLLRSSVGSSQPVIVAVGVVLGLIMCGSCLLAGTLQIKALQCPTSEFISYPLERSVHDALPNPPLNDYAEPVGQKVGSTFRPSSDEGYTTPFALNLYDTPSQMPEYAEPLPPEPEYATPFGDQLQESNTYSAPVPALASGTTSPHPAHYDCPSHKMLSNGYCNPVIHKSDPGLVNEIYAEPKSCNSLLQKHTYEQPL
uniref:Uncharacterized protein n=1 Tax=Periophthalmus magnuspinnatus TaxID=409849 RepID=A0A3B4AHK3_9GOBI